MSDSPPSHAIGGLARNGVRKVLLVEPHPLFREGLKSVMRTVPDMEVIAEAQRARDALAILRQKAVDLAVIDISLPGPNGLELIKSIRAEHETLPLLVLSVQDELVYAPRALRAGANGYLTKNEDAEAILQAMRTVLAGELAVSPRIRNHLIRYAVDRVGDGLDMLSSLSDRELEVLSAVGHGLATWEVAQDLVLSPKTIESHRLHIKQKLHMQSAHQLTVFALEWVAQQDAR